MTKKKKGNTPLVLHRFHPLLIHAALPVNVATESKIKEIFISLFFSRRQWSEVMFSLHENPRFGFRQREKPLPMVAVFNDDFKTNRV